MKLKRCHDLSIIKLYSINIVEEAKEAAEAEPDNLVEELADICEVIDAILVNLEIDKDTVFAKQEQKLREKGGFNKKLRLLWTE